MLNVAFSRIRRRQRRPDRSSADRKTTEFDESLPGVKSGRGRGHRQPLRGDRFAGTSHSLNRILLNYPSFAFL